MQIELTIFTSLYNFQFPICNFQCLPPYPPIIPSIGLLAVA